MVIKEIAFVVAQLIPFQQNPLTITFVPAAPSIPCNSPRGTVVSQVLVDGGNGQPITLSISGDTADFGLDSTSLPANVVVAGLTCSGTYPVTDVVTVEAGQ